MPVAGAVLATDTSADWMTVVAAVIRLFAADGSVVLELTFATFVSVPEPLAGMLTVTLKLVFAPLASVATVGQVMSRPTTVGEPVADTKLTPTGSESVRITAEASLGPAFDAVTV